jgi:hypothetical protein
MAPNSDGTKGKAKIRCHNSFVPIVIFHVLNIAYLDLSI